jgi:hypothetical protein
MREALTEDPQAIGFLPGLWLDESVQMITIEDLDLASFQVPILGITPSSPDDGLRDWLLCLQSEISTQ